MDRGTEIMANDVIFLVEKSSQNGAYINEIKTNYIIATLEFFSGGGRLEEREQIISENNTTLYGVILYKTAQTLPGSAVVTFGPFTSPQKVLTCIEQLELSGGKSESNANLAEGLATALVCFDDLKELRPSDVSNFQRHCIVICNSSPYSLPVVECSQYENKTCEQLAGIFFEKKINLSIISPRKIPILYKLFMKADGENTIQTKNYSRDIKHLVLLKGFSLQERPVSPTQQNQHQTNPIPNLMNANNAMGGQPNNPAMDNNMQGNSMMNQQNPQNNAQVQQQMVPQQMTHMNQNFNGNPQMQQNQFNTQGQVNRWLFPNQQQQQPQTQPQQRPNFIPPGGANQMINQMNSNQGQNSALISQLSTPPNQPGNMMMQQQQQQQNQPQQPMQMIAQQNANQQQGSQQTMMMNQQGSQQQQQQQQQQPQQQTSGSSGNEMPRDKIWSGSLEYNEKTLTDSSKINRSVQCSVFSNIKDGETEVKAENWPSKLLMQLMPKHLVGNIGGQYLKDSKMVVFKMANEGNENLSKVMNNGFAGCVHFTSQPNPPGSINPPGPCNLKILILLYTPEKKTFLGFIPTNQQAFVDRLRKLIQHKQGGQQTTQQQQQQMQMNQQQQQQQNNQPQQQQPQPQYNNYMQGGDNVVMNNMQQPGPGGMNMMQQNQGVRMPNQMMAQQQQVQQQQQMQTLQQHRMRAPMMQNNNPGLRHLLQQQPTVPGNQFRPSMVQMNQNPNMVANMGGNIPGPGMVQNRPPNFDDGSNFDYM